MARLIFVQDPTLEPLLRRSTGLRRVLRGYAEDIAELARIEVPVREGDLRDSIEADVALEPDDGYVGRVNAFHFTAHWIEFGTVRTRPRPFLRPATEIVLGPLEDTDR